MGPTATLTPTHPGPPPPPLAIGPFHALVAAPGFSETSVITSPNQTWVPKFAIARHEIVTFADGRWGLHEYSRWPQAFDHPHFHVACIPRRGAPRAPTSEIVWRTWEDADWRTEECGVPRFGQLKRALVQELESAAESAIAVAHQLPRDDPNIRRIRHFLTVCVRHCVDRLRLLPSERSVIVSLAAHVQRLILELAGLDVYASIVQSRVESQGDFRGKVLNVIGAMSPDPSVVHMLHRAGIPVWFQQHLTPNVTIYSVVPHTELPDGFSFRPSYPRLVLAVRDQSGVLKTPGEWQRAMDATVRRQLCSSRLPHLPSAEDLSPESESKRARLQSEPDQGWNAALGHARVCIPVRDPQHSSTLGHHLRLSARNVCRERARGRPIIRSNSSAGKKPYSMNPFRQHYSSFVVEHSPAWARALQSASPLPQPMVSVAYYFPPPWLIDRLVGYDFNAAKVARYVHHMVAIRMFCRARLFDHSIAGRPLTISEWRDALWGDYALDDHEARPPVSGERASTKGRAESRHRLKQNLRALFGKSGSLRSYEVNAAPVLGNTLVTLEVAKNDDVLHRHLVWEAHETNWRCELLAADALMVGLDSWPEFQRWTRESDVSEVWGPSRSGLALCPDSDEDVPFCWSEPSSADWERCRSHLQAFVDLLARWPGCPSDLRKAHSSVLTCGPTEYAHIQDAAIQFYVRTFVAKFGRLPTPPVRRHPCTRGGSGGASWNSGLSTIPEYANNPVEST